MTSSHLAFLFLGPLLAALTVGAQPGPVAVPSPVPPLSPALEDVVRLVESGIEENVTLAFIRDTHTPYQLTAQTIPYLRDLGLSVALLTAMLDQDRQWPDAAPTRSEPVRLTPPTTTPFPPPVPDETSEPLEYDTNAAPEVAPFYDQLSPFGTWAVIPAVGWCWQPRAAVFNPGWRPYGDGGHWVYTDAGWFWQSDYSWGAATFHYGRWHHDERSGWVWVPDSQWGPAWVTWRKTGPICGWAPLPPGAGFTPAEGYCFRGRPVGPDCGFELPEDAYNFVELKDFSNRELVRPRLPAPAVHLLFSRTTVVNSLAASAAVVSTNRSRPLAAIRVSPPGEGRAARTQQPRHYPVRAQRVNAQHPLIQHAALVPPAPANRAWLPLAQPAGVVAPAPFAGPSGRPPQPEFSAITRLSESRPPALGTSNPSPLNPAAPPAPRGSGPFLPTVLPANPRIYVPRLLPRPAEIPAARPAAANPNQTEGWTKRP